MSEEVKNETSVPDSRTVTDDEADKAWADFRVDLSGEVDFDTSENDNTVYKWNGRKLTTEKSGGSDASGAGRTAGERSWEDRYDNIVEGMDKDPAENGVKTVWAERAASERTNADRTNAGRTDSGWRAEEKINAEKNNYENTAPAGKRTDEKAAAADRSVSSDDDDPEEEKKGRPGDVISWIIIIIAAIALAVVINNVVILKTVITSGSMRPTMEIGEHVIANRLAYMFHEPQRGDMVFFANPDDETETYVKRIIGLPGDKVEIINGKIYINDSDKALKEPYLFEKAEKLDFGPYYVPADCYFMLGDNRNISHDSRFWKTTFVTRDKIYGKAMFGYRIRSMESAEY